MSDWARTLEGSLLAETVRTSLGVYVTLQVVHLLSMAVLVGGGLLLDLRLLGVVRLPLLPLLRTVRPLLLGAAGGAVVTGSLMFAAAAADLVDDPAFRVKVLLLALVLVNAVGFRVGIETRLAEWADRTPPPPAARWAGAVGLTGWVGVVVAARLIAFV